MSNERALRVLIVGATGVFGSRLARLAAREPGVRLTLAGRRKHPLDALSAELGGCKVKVLNRDIANAGDLRGYDLVIDCAGPFQGSHARLIEACISARVDYVDLADGREFVCSIGLFDDAAKRAGIAVISGASSIPALSHAVLDRLTEGWSAIEDIRIGIFPGNRAPRGRSVVEAILSYVGKPVRVFSGGEWREVPGWSLQGRLDCGPAGKRWASVCDTPEQQLLVERYRPRHSAEFVAGMELSVLHLGLWLLSFPVRWGGINSLRPFSGLLLWIARQLQPFGSDRGAMIVEVAGRDAHGAPVAAKWTLDATTNLGPHVPVLAALVLIRRMAGGWKPKHGACPCSGILTLGELEELLDSLGILHLTSRRGACLRHFHQPSAMIEHRHVPGPGQNCQLRARDQRLHFERVGGADEIIVADANQGFRPDGRELFGRPPGPFGEHPGEPC
jgi:saccharopine dehydrogenase-like NADP-dependent oxidoreductase